MEVIKCTATQGICQGLSFPRDMLCNQVDVVQGQQEPQFPDTTLHETVRRTLVVERVSAGLIVRYDFKG